MRFSKPAIFLILLLFSWSDTVLGQSLDINAPSPVSTTEVMGRIVARDLGDARFTDHYYSFAGNKGDLVVTIESSNLNGDVDIFTAGTLRPLLKFTIYAEISGPITKAIFLRQRENLILRVQARTPNDDEGSYQIRFGGTFEPLAASPFATQTETPTDEASTLTARSDPGKGRRVSSVGARIKEPEPPPEEVAAAPSPEPTPEPTPEVAPLEPATSAVTEKPDEAEAPKTTPPANTRTRRPAGRRSRTRPQVTREKETTSVTQPAEQPEVAAETPPISTSSRRSTSRRSSAREKPAEPQPAEPDPGPRLVIETTDGTLIDRSMSTVRRVMVEKGQIVVVGNDGRVQRIALSQVVRMSIAP